MRQPTIRTRPRPRPLPLPLPLLAVLLVALPSTAATQEFTRQTLLVAPLHPDGSNRVARQVAGGLRTRIGRMSVRRELFVVGSDTVESLLENSGFRADTVLNEVQTLVLARQMRADEVVVGRVISRPGVVEVHATLRIMRDWRLRQPLPVVRATSVTAAADTLGGIDVLVNNASGFGRSDDEEGWAASIDVDLAAELRPEHVSALLAALQEACDVPAKAAADAVAARRSFNVIHLATMKKVDVFVSRRRPFDRSVFDRLPPEVSIAACLRAGTRCRAPKTSCC